MVRVDFEKLYVFGYNSSYDSGTGHKIGAKMDLTLKNSRNSSR